VSRLAQAFAVILCIVFCGCAKQDKQKEVPAFLQGSYKSLKAIEGATAVGVTYADYLKLLQEMSAEVLALDDYLKANPSPQYRALVEELDRVLTMYVDAGTAWKAEIEASSSLLKRRDLKSYPQAELVALKYGMTERLVSMRIVQNIWSLIGERAPVLHGAFYGTVDLNLQKPKTIDQLREAALAKKGVADCVEVEDWSPDVKTPEGWFIVGKIVNRCGKSFNSVPITFIIWRGGDHPSGELVRDLGGIGPGAEKTFRIPYSADITGVRYKAVGEGRTGVLPIVHH